MRVTIGGREIIQSFSLLVPGSEDAWLEFRADDWNIRLRITFEDDPSTTSSRFDLTAKGDHAHLSVKNWNNSLPSAIEQPVQLGQSGNRRVLFLFSGYAVGTLKRFDLCFLWEK